MGRELRYIRKNTTYHAYSRCLGGKNLLKKDRYKDLLIEVIKECKSRYDFNLCALQIMDNHFHIIIKTLSNIKHSISVIMKWIKSTFTRRYNRLFRKRKLGPFWNERFGAKVIDLANDAKDYLNTLLWYLEYNPIRKGITKKPGESPFGTINHYLKYEMGGKAIPLSPFLEHHEYFIKLSTDIKERLKSFLKYEESFKKRYSDFSDSKEVQKTPFYKRLHHSFVSRKKEKELNKKLAEKLRTTRR